MNLTLILNLILKNPVDSLVSVSNSESMGVKESSGRKESRARKCRSTERGRSHGRMRRVDNDVNTSNSKPACLMMIMIMLFQIHMIVMREEHVMAGKAVAQGKFMGRDGKSGVVVAEGEVMVVEIVDE